MHLFLKQKFSTHYVDLHMQRNIREERCNTIRIAFNSHYGFLVLPVVNLETDCLFSSDCAVHENICCRVAEGLRPIVVERIIETPSIT